MNLEIENFGPINKANMELKKLNVIAGINGSGKTTSSKLLYCFLTSCSDERDYLANLSINRRFKSIISRLNYEFESDDGISDKLIEVYAKLPKSNDKNYNSQLKNCINQLKIILNEISLIDKENYIEQINNFESVLEVNASDYRRFFDVSNVLLKSEFKLNEFQVNNSNVKFYGKHKDNKFSYRLDLNDSKWGFRISEGNSIDLNFSNVIYMDSLSIFEAEDLADNLILKKQPYHLRFLSQALMSSKNGDDVYDDLFNLKLDEFVDEIALVIGGHIYFDDDKDEFKFKKDDQDYSMKNTASGIKQLGIIQFLLSNRKLTENSFIIMDEPEINIHPEWQVKFAKLIILMIKKLNMSIFINSHSPQFIEALEVYSGKYGLIDESKFYLSCENENGKFDFEEINRDDLVILYNNLGDSYDVINKVRAENMKNGIF